MISIFQIASLVILFAPTVVFGAVEYAPLVDIPYLTGGGVSDFSSFINTLYALSISIAALLAVVKIIIAGMKWMLSDVVTNKSEAKKDIQSALLGLLIIIAAVLIISVINPDIVN